MQGMQQGRLVVSSLALPCLQPYPARRHQKDFAQQPEKPSCPCRVFRILLSLPPDRGSVGFLCPLGMRYVQQRSAWWGVALADHKQTCLRHVLAAWRVTGCLKGGDVYHTSQRAARTKDVIEDCLTSKQRNTRVRALYPLRAVRGAVARLWPQTFNSPWTESVLVTRLPLISGEKSVCDFWCQSGSSPKSPRTRQNNVILVIQWEHFWYSLAWLLFLQLWRLGKKAGTNKWHDPQGVVLGMRDPSSARAKCCLASSARSEVEMRC